MREAKIHRLSSGLYNIIFGDGGEAQRGELVRRTIGNVDFGRFRDAWVERADGDIRYAVYTRNGGGNRDDQDAAIQSMRANRYYLFDKDDQFDSTYATFYFSVPIDFQLSPDAQIPDGLDPVAEWRRTRALITKDAIEPVDMDELWKAALEQVRRDPNMALKIADAAGLTDVIDKINNEPEEGA